MRNKATFYKSIARDFTEKIKGFDSVDEIAIFGSVSGGDPFARDVDMLTCIML